MVENAVDLLNVVQQKVERGDHAATDLVRGKVAALMANAESAQAESSGSDAGNTRRLSGPPSARARSRTNPVCFPASFQKNRKARLTISSSSSSLVNCQSAGTACEDCPIFRAAAPKTGLGERIAQRTFGQKR